jgi:hypothetical protein
MTLDNFRAWLGSKKKDEILGNAHGWVTNPLANWAVEIAFALNYRYANACIEVSAERIRMALVPMAQWRYYRTPLWQMVLMRMMQASAKSLLTRENVEALLDLSLNIAGYKGEEGHKHGGRYEQP